MRGRTRRREYVPDKTLPLPAFPARAEFWRLPARRLHFQSPRDAEGLLSAPISVVPTQLTREAPQPHPHAAFQRFLSRPSVRSSSTPHPPPYVLRVSPLPVVCRLRSRLPH